MSAIVFDHFIWVSWISISVSFTTLILGMLWKIKTPHVLSMARLSCMFIAIVALGMSSDIKHLNYIGICHALIATAIAVFATRHLKTKFAYLLFVPCSLIAIVIVFNLLHKNIGLELLGRWTQ